ncbi:MAG: adenylate/guanylate cyclase domain-containing protein [Pirellulales bacterium]
MIEDHASRACAAALKMRAAMADINARWRDRIGETTDVSIGINTGTAQVGNIGSRRKFKYGAFGTTVNLASRVQGATKHVGASLLVTRSCVDRLTNEFARRRLCSIRTINIDQPVEIHELFPDDHPHRRTLSDLYERAIAHFDQGDFAATKNVLDDLLAKHPDDEPAKKLLSRAAKPATSPHDPIWTLDAK